MSRGRPNLVPREIFVCSGEIPKGSLEGRLSLGLVPQPSSQEHFDGILSFIIKTCVQGILLCYLCRIPFPSYSSECSVWTLSVSIKLS